jgi:L-cysteine S-thiosulfotransferase
VIGRTLSFSRTRRRIAPILTLLWFGCPAQAQFAPYTIDGGAIPAPLLGLTGDAARGRAIVANRQKGLCLLCHSGPIPEERFQGNLAPSLAGAGSRSTEGQIRLRMVDSRRVNPESVMPAYHAEEGLQRVGRTFAGKPVLTAQEIEDVVAYLGTLKE